MRPRLWVPVLVTVITIVPSPLTVSAFGQEASVWMDVNATHSRPPTGTDVGTASYGLLGLRINVVGRRSAFDLGAVAGRGVGDGGGGWLSGQTGLSLAGVSRRLDFGMRAEGSGLSYLSPVQFGTGDEFTQWLALGTVRPYVGVSFGRSRLGAEGMFAGGRWGTRVTTVTTSSPTNPPVLPPVGGPGPGDAGRTTVRDDGPVTIAGGSASLSHAVGPAILEVRAGSYHAENQVARGQYTGVDGTATLALGTVTLSAGVRRWTSPVEGEELGGHLGLGVALGSGANLLVAASRSVSDPRYGSAGDVGVSAGVSMRLGRRGLGPPPPVRVGVASGTGRAVRFLLKRPQASQVAVAGDFNGWEPRAMGRGSDGVWTLETVLPPGVYHYSFVVDGTIWVVPDHATGRVDDGFGRKNAILVVNALSEEAGS